MSQALTLLSYCPAPLNNYGIIKEKTRLASKEYHYNYDDTNDDDNDNNDKKKIIIVITIMLILTIK